MKSILKYLSSIVIILIVFSCTEEDHFLEPDIALTPVYSITDIQGSNTPFKINVYREKNLIIEYISQVNPLSFVSSGYTDSSTDTNYQILVNKIDDSITINYVISADKTTGVGTLTVDSGTVYNIKIIEDSVYN
jgi:hypothetical protein